MSLTKLFAQVGYFQNLGLDPRKPVPMKNMDNKKHGINMGLKIYLTLESYVLCRPCAMWFSL